MRFILTGGGAWDQYVEEYATKKEAKLAALYWLDRGYDACLIDNSTGERCELCYRYDGLGIA